MTFRIYAILPTYDNRDAIVGSHAMPQPGTYRTTEAALTDMARLVAADEIMGDSEMISYVVVPDGFSPFDDRHVIRPEVVDPGFADIPF